MSVQEELQQILATLFKVSESIFKMGDDDPEPIYENLESVRAMPISMPPSLAMGYMNELSTRLRSTVGTVSIHREELESFGVSNSVDDKTNIYENAQTKLLALPKIDKDKVTKVSTVVPLKRSPISESKRTPNVFAIGEEILGSSETFLVDTSPAVTELSGDGHYLSVVEDRYFETDAVPNTSSPATIRPEVKCCNVVSDIEDAVKCNARIIPSTSTKSSQDTFKLGLEKVLFSDGKKSPLTMEPSLESFPIYENYYFDFSTENKKHVDLEAQTYSPAAMERQKSGRNVSPAVTSARQKANPFSKPDISGAGDYLSMNRKWSPNYQDKMMVEVLVESPSPSTSPRGLSPVFVRARQLRRSRRKLAEIVGKIGDSYNDTLVESTRKKLNVIETKSKELVQKIEKLGHADIDDYLDTILSTMNVIDKIISDASDNDELKPNADLAQDSVVYRNPNRLHHETCEFIRNSVLSAPMYQSYKSNLSDLSSSDEGYTTEPKEPVENDYANLEYLRRQERAVVICIDEEEVGERGVQAKEKKKKGKKKERVLIQDRDVVADGKRFEIVHWCQLPNVVERKLIGKLTQSERCLQEAKYEVISSKVSYLKSLSVLQAVFMDNTGLAKLMSREDHDGLFKYIRPIRSCSELFLTDLLSGWPEDIFLKNMLTVVGRYADSGLQAYVDYCDNRVKMDVTLRNIRLNCPLINEELKLLEADEICSNHTLESFLVLPIQRITRFPILVEAIIKRLEPDDEDLPGWKEALRKLQKKAVECNDAVRRAEDSQAIVEESEHHSHISTISKLKNWHKHRHAI